MINTNKIQYCSFLREGGHLSSQGDEVGKKDKGYTGISISCYVLFFKFDIGYKGSFY